MSTIATTQQGAYSPLMRPATKHLSVVVGCYNAALHLEKTIIELLGFLNQIGRNYELLIVEDGSVDDSLPILRRLEQTLPQLTILRNPVTWARASLFGTAF